MNYMDIRKNKITDYEELLKSEREIEEIINKKIF